ADDFPVRRLVEIFEFEQFLGDDDFALHPDHFGYVGGAARTVAETFHMHDEVDGIRDLAADRLLRDFDVRHHHHVFHTSQAFARAVGVERSHRSIVAGVHGGQKVEALAAANFAKDDAIRTHTQCVDD